jgi:hypothetical protein
MINGWVGGKGGMMERAEIRDGQATAWKTKEYWKVRVQEAGRSVEVEIKVEHYGGEVRLMVEIPKDQSGPFPAERVRSWFEAIRVISPLFPYDQRELAEPREDIQRVCDHCERSPGPHCVDCILEPKSGEARDWIDRFCREAQEVHAERARDLAEV